MEPTAWLDAAARFAREPAVAACLAMLLGGAVLERFFGTRARRRDWLNWLYAPVFLVIEVTTIALAFSAFRALARAHDVGYLIPWRLGGPGLGETLLGLLAFMVILDGVLYAMHRVQHQTRLLWTGHRLHHSDDHVDVSTTVRLHAIDLVFKAVCIGLFFTIIMPPPIVADRLFFVIPFVWLYYIHLDIEVGHGRLWWLLASPRYHYLHHEKIRSGHGCNFASIFPVWDLMFGTAASSRRPADIEIGLADWRPLSLWEMIARPFSDCARCAAGWARRWFGAA